MHIRRRGLPTYESRRRYLNEEFAQILSSREGTSDETEKEAFFPKGASHDAYTHVRSVLQAATRDLFIVDG